MEDRRSWYSSELIEDSFCFTFCAELEPRGHETVVTALIDVVATLDAAGEHR
jgi:hypothetical protein